MKVEVEKSSPEWERVHYRIQLVLGLPAALPDKIFRFTNFQNQFQQMKHQYSDKNILDGHINTSKLDDLTQKKLIQRKYKMSDLIIETGHLDIQIDSRQTKKSYSLWLLKAVVGDSFCVQVAENKQIPSGITLPQQYDSIYISMNGKEHLYRHDYILRQADQYAIQYQVFYSLNKQRQYNSRQIPCDRCQRRSSVMYCKQQEAYFCSQCNVVHHKNKLLDTHIRQELTKFNTVQLCPQQNHGKRLQLYCQICDKTMCIQCTISGWHSNKSFGNHQVTSLKKYYQQKKLQNDDISKGKKSELQESLRNIESAMTQVDKQANILQEKLTQIYENAKKQLKQNTKHKLSKLQVVKIQTKRQYDQLIWTDSFIKYQQQLLKPIPYLEAQKKYEQFKQTLLQIPIKSLPKIQYDNLEISGQILIVQATDNFNTNLKQHQQSHSSNRNPFKSQTKNSSNTKTPPFKPSSNLKQKQISDFNSYNDQSSTHVLGSYAAPILEASLRNAKFTAIKFE